MSFRGGSPPLNVGWVSLDERGGAGGASSSLRRAIVKGLSAAYSIARNHHMQSQQNFLRGCVSERVGFLSSGGKRITVFSDSGRHACIVCRQEASERIGVDERLYSRPLAPPDRPNGSTRLQTLQCTYVGTCATSRRSRRNIPTPRCHSVFCSLSLSIYIYVIEFYVFFAAVPPAGPSSFCKVASSSFFLIAAAVLSSCFFSSSSTSMPSCP